MAILKAFKGLRPPKKCKRTGFTSYDVLNSSEAREEARNPYPFSTLLTGIDFRLGQMSMTTVYEKARENFGNSVRAAGSFRILRMLYIYAQTIERENTVRNCWMCCCYRYMNNITGSMNLPAKDKEEDR